MKSCGDLPRQYYIDKVLGIVPRKLPDPLNLTIIREDCRDQRDAVVRSGATIGRLFLGQMFAAYRESSQVNDDTIVGMDKELTGQELAGLLKLPGANEGRDFSSVVSVSTNHLSKSDAPAVVGACLPLWPTQPQKIIRS